MGKEKGEAKCGSLEVTKIMLLKGRKGGKGKAPEGA